MDSVRADHPRLIGRRDVLNLAAVSLLVTAGVFAHAAAHPMRMRSRALHQLLPGRPYLEQIARMDLPERPEEMLGALAGVAGSLSRCGQAAVRANACFREAGLEHDPVCRELQRIRETAAAYMANYAACGFEETVEVLSAIRTSARVVTAALEEEDRD